MDDPAARLTSTMRRLEESFLLGVEEVTEIWLCRHGDCYEGLLDHRDPELSSAGKVQAAALGERVRRAGYDALWCSDSRRAQQTAAAIGDGAIVDRRLREIENDPAAAVEAAGGGPIFSEEVAGAQDRFRQAVDEAAAAHRGGRVVVVAHGGIIIAHLCEVLRIDFPRLRILPYYTSVSVVRLLDGRRMAGSLGDVAHLETFPGWPHRMPGSGSV